MVLTTALVRVATPRLLDEDAAHRLGDGGKKMTATIPVLCLGHVDKPHVRFMDQGRRLKRVSRGFLSHLLSREFAQLLVDEGQQFTGGAWVALLDGGQDARDLG